MKNKKVTKLLAAVLAFALTAANTPEMLTVYADETVGETQTGEQTGTSTEEDTNDATDAKGTVTFGAMTPEVYAEGFKTGWEGKPRNVTDFGSFIVTESGESVTVTGDANYVSGFTGFNTTVPQEQSGYYAAWQFALKAQGGQALTGDALKKVKIYIQSGDKYKLVTSENLDTVAETPYFNCLTWLGKNASSPRKIYIDWAGTQVLTPDGDNMYTQDTVATLLNVDRHIINFSGVNCKAPVTFEMMDATVFNAYSSWEGIKAAPADFGDYTFTPAEKGLGKGDTEYSETIKVTGTAKKIDGFTGFNKTETEEQSGYYLIWQVKIPEKYQSSATYKLKSRNGNEGDYKTFDQSVLDNGANGKKYFSNIFHMSETGTKTTEFIFDPDGAGDQLPQKYIIDYSDVKMGSTGGSTGDSTGGSTVETSTETKPDGTKTETVVETTKDGGIKTTETVTAADGSAVKKENETATNAKGKEVEVTTTTEMNADGTITSATERSVIKSPSSTTSATVTVEKTGDGEITSANANIAKTVESGNKATIEASVISQITEAAGTTDVEVTMIARDEDGNTKYKVKVDAGDLQAGEKLYLYKLNTKTGEFVIVDAKTYNVSESGSVAVSIKNKATYALVDEAQSNQIVKAIKSTIKPKKSSVAVKKGKNTTLALSSKVNKSNIKSITYTTSKKSVAVVNKSGKIVSKGKGTAVVKAKVTLKNGMTKTIKMKVKVK